MIITKHTKVQRRIIYDSLIGQGDEEDIPFMVDCPDPKCLYAPRSILSMVEHLNDDHEFHFTYIAMWLDTLPYKVSFK